MQIKDLDGIHMVELACRIDVTSSPALENLLDGLLDGGQTKIVCDFSNTEYVSSVGLRVFLSALKRTAKAGGSLVLCSLKPGILEIFDMTGFAALFTIFDSTEAALGFIQSREAKGGKEHGEIAEIIIDKQPDEVTRAYSSKSEPGRMDAKI